MAQVTDRNIGANPTGFDMRTEINNIIASLESDNSGSSEPLNTVAYMKWLDTSNATYYYVKERNHDNTAWVTLFRYTVSTKIMEAVSDGVVLQDSNLVHKTGNETKTGTMTFMDNVGIGDTPTFQLDLQGGTTVNYRLNASRGNDDVNQGVKFGFGGIDAYRTSATLSQPQTEINFTQTASDGTRTPLKIDVNGNVVALSGIKLPNTAIANSTTLDWYEEGTFTPTITGASSAGTGTYTSQIGKYTRIGNRVLFQIFITVTSHSGTGFIKFSGLPFTANSQANNYVAVTIADPNSLTFSGFLSAYITNGTSQITLSSATSGITSTGVNMDASFSIMLSGEYEI